MVSNFKDLRHLQKIHVERNFIGNWIFPWEFRSKMGLETQFCEPSPHKWYMKPWEKRECPRMFRERRWLQTEPGWGSQPISSRWKRACLETEKTYREQ